mgnify:CR=1 FL=1
MLSSGYQPFHFYIVLQGRAPFALNMKFFNMREIQKNTEEQVFEISYVVKNTK